MEQEDSIDQICFEDGDEPREVAGCWNEQEDFVDEILYADGCDMDGLKGPFDQGSGEDDSFRPEHAVYDCSTGVVSGRQMEAPRSRGQHWGPMRDFENPCELMQFMVMGLRRGAG